MLNSFQSLVLWFKPHGAQRKSWTACIQQPAKRCWLIIHSVSPSPHNSFPQHNLAPCPTGWPWRKTITREAEQQYPENICLCRLGPSTCLTVCPCWLRQGTHAWLNMADGPKCTRPQSPAPCGALPSACLPADPPAFLTACLPSLAAAALSEQTRVRLLEQLFVWVKSLLLGWNRETVWQDERKAMKIAQWTYIMHISRYIFRANSESV